MQKLNFGCGKRFASDWTNIDFHSESPQVKQVNLLSGFPFPDDSFDVVYSSHVLEHFHKEEAEFLLKEAYRVLKPTGIIRIVVPDLESLCREYLRVLDLPDDAAQKLGQYEWIVIELLDQLVRSETFGEMGKFYLRLHQKPDMALKAYVESRIGNIPNVDPIQPDQRSWLLPIHFQQLRTQLTYGYLKLLSYLIPKNLRSTVLVQTTIGERHRWMYDSYRLGRLLDKIGFSDCQAMSYRESAIPDFNADYLDCNVDGLPYKPNSIYLEARR